MMSTSSKDVIDQQKKMLQSKSVLIDRMQVMLDRFKQQRFGPSSEKFPGQHEIQFINEAELLAHNQRA